MRTEAEVRQVLEAVREADPNLEDEVTSMIYDTLRWILNEDPKSAEQFIQDYVEEI